MPSDWTRRQLHQHLALGGLAWMAGCKGGDPADTSVAPVVPRGVVLITADDLGWRDLSSYGLTAVQTPNLDRLVSEGVAFDRAFDVVSTCSSSRASLATGQYPHTHGVTGLTHRHPELSLPTDAPTLARTLRDHGLATALQGKWHLSAEAPAASFGYDTALATDIDQRIRTVAPALDFLNAHADGGFFVELNFMQTHRDLFDRFVQADGFPVSVDVAAPPEFWALPDLQGLREEVAGYLSQLAWMDSLVGEVLGTLDALGLTDDVLVVFLSDNGPPFPGCKLTLYDRGVGTPLVFRWPAALAPRWETELVSTVQIAPTVLELCAAPALPGAQGRSLAPLLRGEPWSPAEAVYSEMELHIDPLPCRAVRTATHKYIRNLSSDPWGPGDGNAAYFEALADEPDQRWDEPRAPEELYDLVSDPMERVDLSGDPAHAGVLASLRALLRSHAEATDDPRLAEL
ncbi:MAG: sulfatase [Myxococcota bacterium]